MIKKRGRRTRSRGTIRGTFAGAAALLSLTAIPSAWADADYDACLKTAVSNFDMAACGSAYLKRADLALNNAWRAAFGQASGQTTADLLTEQRLWVAFKDKSCLFWTSGEHGREGQVLSFPACRGEVIEERTRALKNVGRDLAPR